MHDRDDTFQMHYVDHLLTILQSRRTHILAYFWQFISCVQYACTVLGTSLHLFITSASALAIVVHFTCSTVLRVNNTEIMIMLPLGSVHHLDIVAILTAAAVSTSARWFPCWTQLQQTCNLNVNWVTCNRWWSNKWFLKEKIIQCTMGTYVYDFCVCVSVHICICVVASKTLRYKVTQLNC